MAGNTFRYSRTGMLLLVLGIGLWLAGLVWFYQQVPQEEDFPDSGVRTDAIVVLTGGMGRIEHGLELLKAGRAKRLLISGVDLDVKPPEMVAQYGIDTAHPALTDGATRIILDYGPRDTVGNAHETARWMQDHGLRSMRLVTSSYHMPRSLLEFRRAMPDAIILPAPVFPEWNTLDKVVLVPRGSLRLILLEYHKYLFRRLYYALPDSWQVLASRTSDQKPAEDIDLSVPEQGIPDESVTEEPAE